MLNSARNSLAAKSGGDLSFVLTAAMPLCLAYSLKSYNILYKYKYCNQDYT